MPSWEGLEACRQKISSGERREERGSEKVEVYNHELVEINRVNTEACEEHRHHLREVIEEFVAESGSAWGQTILDNFGDYIGKFWLVKPKAADLESLLEDLQRAAA